MVKTKKHSHKWFLVGLLGVLIAAPNATFIKYAIEGSSPIEYNLLRFFLAAALTTPFIYSARKRITRQNLRESILAGVFLAVGVMCFITAIKISTASYVSIITLATPILFVLLSSRINNERINVRAVAGVTLAAIGAMVIVILPIAIRQEGEFVVYPMATLLALINSVMYSLAVIKLKIANEDGVPMTALMSITSWVVCITALALFGFTVTQGASISAPSGRFMLGVIYSGVAVALVARIMTIVSYEHIGSVVTSALAYLETLAAIIIPIVILGEVISVEMVAGGILILIGVYVAEYHKSPHHKQHHLFRHH